MNSDREPRERCGAGSGPFLPGSPFSLCRISLRYRLSGSLSFTGDPPTSLFNPVSIPGSWSPASGFPHDQSQGTVVLCSTWQNKSSQFSVGVVMSDDGDDGGGDDDNEDHEGDDVVMMVMMMME